MTTASTQELNYAAARIREKAAETADPKMKPAVSIGDTLEASLERLQQITDEAVRKGKELDKWLQTKPKTIPCIRHSFNRQVNRERSARESQFKPEFVAVYNECPSCVQEEKRRKQNRHWADRGVPEKYLGKTLDELHYSTPKCQENLRYCRKFSENPKGVLVLVGSYGTGKTHSASAILQAQGKGLFVSHSSLLEAHRATYRDEKLHNIKREATCTPLLVIDEIGISTGGKDEFDLLYSILNSRYETRRPTILISNILLKDFKQFIGDRLVDRLKESIFALCDYDEPSYRSEQNERYLGMEGDPEAPEA